MSFINASKKKGPQPGDSHIPEGSDILVINCRGCDQSPKPDSGICIGCICNAILDNGAAEAVKLEAGKDIEVSGKAAEILCDLAKLNGPACGGCSKGRCARCSRSPDRIMESVWAEFPDPNFGAACSRLYTDSRDGPECSACLQSTYSALMSAEKEMTKIREKAARIAGRKEVSA